MLGGGPRIRTARAKEGRTGGDFKGEGPPYCGAALFGIAAFIAGRQRIAVLAADSGNSSAKQRW
jgi:hypothetical protein